MPRIDWLHLALLSVWLLTVWRVIHWKHALRREQDACSNLRNLVREMQNDRRC